MWVGISEGGGAELKTGKDAKENKQGERHCKGGRRRQRVIMSRVCSMGPGKSSASR